MPIYEYRCDRCEHEFEELARSMNARAKVKCPECGGTQVNRKQSTFAARSATGVSCALPDGACQNTECAGGQCPMMM
ncbi:MAG: zinc ribbon domain-containing protein [bacterium]|nr:zinc ribbon domain-containing protein [bacterium]